MDTKTKPEPMLWLDSARGVYIPQEFTKSFIDPAKHVFGVSAEDWKTLEHGPSDEYYWEAWDNVLTHCFVIDEAGIKWSVYQDGDCWLIPDGMIWDDKLEWFIWEQIP